MKRFSLRRLRRPSLGFGVTVILLTATALWVGASPVQALPEYATRTGEACATCHVSAGGGGPRTLRGLLWAARGRPDKVPALPNMLLAPRVSNAAELYDIACAGCHGLKGEGLFAIELIGTGIGSGAVHTFILDGIPTLGMPGFKGQFTETQLKTLVAYVVGLGNGSIAPPLDQYPLQPGRLKCPSPTCASGTGAITAPLTTSKGN